MREIYARVFCEYLGPGEFANQSIVRVAGEELLVDAGKVIDLTEGRYCLKVLTDDTSLKNPENGQLEIRLWKLTPDNNRNLVKRTVAFDDIELNSGKYAGR